MKDFNSIKGYKSLEKWQQELLKETYSNHMEYIENKEQWEIESVKWDNSYLKVTFKNGTWLHYTKSGHWY